MVNFGANDIRDMKVDLILGLVWQIVRGHLMRHINLASHPELIRLLNDKESLKELVGLKSEAILLRW